MAGPWFLFDRPTTARMRESVRKTEGQAEVIPDPFQERFLPDECVRIRLTTPLEYGRQGLGFILTLDEHPPKSSYFNWVIANCIEVPVWHSACGMTALDPGAEVTAVYTQHGYVVVNESLMAYILSVTEIVPYGVYKIAKGSTDNRETFGAIKLQEDISAELDPLDDHPIWTYDFAFLGRTRSSYETAYIRFPTFDLKIPSTTVSRHYPCTVNLPTRVAYSTELQADVPDEVKTALGWAAGDHPEPDEYWGPIPADAYLHRSADILSLYWWEWALEPRTEQQKVTLTAAPALSSWKYVLDGVQSSAIVVTAPDSAVQSALEGMSNIGVGNVLVTGSVGGPYTITFQGTLALQDISQGSFVAASGAIAGYVETLVDGRDEEKRQWIAPDKWWGNWGYAGWGWNSLNQQAWWNKNLPSHSWWGGYGYGWWNSMWGGKSPIPGVDIFADTVDPPVPTDGVITKYCIYGYVVYEHGWRVLSVDTVNELVFIGPNKEMTFNRTLVVVNGDITTCPGYDGGSV